MKKTKMKKKNLLGNLTAKIMGALRGREARLAAAPRMAAAAAAAAVRAAAAMAPAACAPSNSPHMTSQASRRQAEPGLVLRRRRSKRPL